MLRKGLIGLFSTIIASELYYTYHGDQYLKKLNKYVRERLYGKKLNDYMYKRFSGKDFNENFSHIPLYKLTNKDETHYEMKYYDGLNIDINQDKFDRIIPYYHYTNFFVDTTDYGIYFTDKPKLWASIIDGHEMDFIRNVTIPDDAKVVIGNNCVRADKVILGKRIPFKEFIE
jgi:hypothetical protein